MKYVLGVVTFDNEAFVRLEELSDNGTGTGIFEEAKNFTFSGRLFVGKFNQLCLDTKHIKKIVDEPADIPTHE